MPTSASPTQNDVSYRVTGYTVQYFLRHGLATDKLTQGLDIDLEQLQSPSLNFSWDDYLRFTANVYAQLTDSQWIEFCSNYATSPLFRPLLSAFGLAFAPIRYYQWAVDPNGGLLRQLFRCIHARITPVNAHEIILEEQLSVGYTPPPDWLWTAHGLAFAALPTHFGLNPAIISWEPIERGAAFHIRLPRRRPIRHFFSWIGSWFHGDMQQEMRALLAYAHERTLRLEREISERRRIEEARATAEAALRESERVLSTLVRNLPGMVYRCRNDEHWTMTFVSDGSRDVTGYDACQLLENREIAYGDLIHPDDRNWLWEKCQSSLAAGIPCENQYRILDKSSGLRWVHERAAGVYAEYGTLLSIEGFVQDISERRRAEAALRENELRYRQLFDLNPIPMWLYDCETLRFLEVNEAAIANYGYSREEFAQMTLLDIRSPEDVPALLESVARVTQGRDDARILRHHRTRDGQEIMVRITSHALITNGRRCEIVSALNVTDQLRAEQRMRESESTLRTIIESEPECVKLVDRSCCLQEMNPAGLRLIEAERIEDVRGACVLSLVAERHREAFETMCRAVFRGEAQRLEFEMIGLNGMHRILDTHSVPLWNADHTEVRAMLGVTRDVTERKHSEAALRASEERQRLALEATQWASGAST